MIYLKKYFLSVDFRLNVQKLSLKKSKYPIPLDSKYHLPNLETKIFPKKEVSLDLFWVKKILLDMR